MKLKITINPPCDGERNIEIVTYTSTGERSHTIFSKEDEMYLLHGHYACGFIDGVLAAFGFSTEMEKQSIKDLMRIHVNKTIVLTYARLYCNIEIKEARNEK